MPSEHIGMKRVRGRLGLSLLLAALAFAGCGAETETDGSDTAAGGPPPATGEPVVFADCQKPAVEPNSITIACGDADFVLEDLEWSSWGGDTADASAVARVNSCEPSCADGKWQEYDAKVSLSTIEECKGESAYAAASIDFAGKSPAGFDDPYETDLACGPTR
jgi:hypothetical protein